MRRLRRAIWTVGAILGTLVLARDAIAQGRNISVEAMRSEARVALVIGNSAYAGPANLRNPVNDARDMAQALRGLGFDVLLSTDADLKQMQRAVRDFGNRLKQGGIGLFYYAGHGVQVRGNNYLVPLGARIGREEEVEDEALDVARVLRSMEESRSRVSIVVLDACRDNPFARSFRSATRGLAVVSAPSGTFVAYATGPGAVAADGEGRNGLFTGELLKAMRVPGVPIEATFKQVVASVRQRTNGRQVPWTLSSLDGEFVFALPQTVSVVPPPEQPPRPRVTVEPRQALGSLAVTSRVAGVEVWLGDDRIGETLAGKALIVSDLATGTYRLKASKQGYTAWERQVTVVADRRAEILIDIEPLRQEPPPVTRTEDGAEMVLVPAGEFWMGSDQRDDEKPRHHVYLDAFQIDKYEVTNARFERFVRATGHPTPAYWSDSKWNGERQPVVGVSWHDADAYCRWAGKRLPTEAEWEKAARGTDGRTYPWGDQWDSSRANSSGGRGGTVAVGSYPGGVSPYGAHDMAGNVWEWVADWYDGGYYRQSPERNPPGPASGTTKVLRGGSWFDYRFYLRTASRLNQAPGRRDSYLGFRCARGS